MPLNSHFVKDFTSKANDPSVLWGKNCRLHKLVNHLRQRDLIFNVTLVHCHKSHNAEYEADGSLVLIFITYLELIQIVDAANIFPQNFKHNKTVQGLVHNIGKPLEQALNVIV